jgi:hypothetical protein
MPSLSGNVNDDVKTRDAIQFGNYSIRYRHGAPPIVTRWMTCGRPVTEKYFVESRRPLHGVAVWRGYITFSFYRSPGKSIVVKPTLDYTPVSFGIGIPLDLLDNSRRQTPDPYETVRVSGCEAFPIRRERHGF